MASQNFKFFRGSILNPLDDKSCDFFEDGVLVVQVKNKTEKIKDLLSWSEAQDKYKKELSKKNLKVFKNQIIMPGFFDMHFHWVQDDVRQMPKDSLLEWLEKYTFPTEQKFENKTFAKARAKKFFKKLLHTGTIGGACYSSIHEHALQAAQTEAKGHFVIGNVLMNMNSPEKLTQTEKESLELTKRNIKNFGKKFCFTPRFAITTTPKVMSEGAKLTDKAKCFKQTHLSETPAEIDFVLSIYKNLPGFKKVKSYTEIYEKSGMLGERSLMGHGIYLSKKELKVLSKTRTSVIHCPTSNAPIKERGLGSGLFDFKAVEKMKVRWAMGSDIGGGPFLSMFDVMRSFVDQHQKNGNKKATFVKALYRSTLAGAEILGLEKKAGNFKKGKEVSFIVVDKKGKPESAEEALSKIILPHSKKREAYDGLVKFVYLESTIYKTQPR
jgi:guanine deaminase